VIDLDPGSAVFAPGAAAPMPEIAAAIEELRAAGVIVLWVSQASANDVAGVAAALQASGLDPTGRDPILLVRNAEERKQVLREEANATVCVVAIAGDRRSDFDELFDYLRDPRLETAYDAQIGAGWFIVPPLFGASPASAVPPAGEDSGR
jgi:predicted secreted acid phosphatase